MAGAMVVGRLAALRNEKLCGVAMERLDEAPGLGQ